MSDLSICRLSDASASVAGGREIILLCEKVTKGIILIYNFELVHKFNKYILLDDISIRFYEEVDGKLKWEGYADFQPSDVHKQVAIHFRTPKYETLQVNIMTFNYYFLFE